jgi:hypothetical protein
MKKLIDFISSLFVSLLLAFTFIIMILAVVAFYIGAAFFGVILWIASMIIGKEL